MYGAKTPYQVGWRDGIKGRSYGWGIDDDWDEDEINTYDEGYEIATEELNGGREEWDDRYDW